MPAPHHVVVPLLAATLASAACAAPPAPPAADVVARLADRDCRPGDACAVDLGEVERGAVAGTAFDVVNLGDAPAEIVAVEVLGDPSYALLASPAGALAPGASAPLAIAAEPLSASRVTATVYIGVAEAAEDEREARDVIAVDLGVTGVVPALNGLRVERERCDFGDVVVGETSAPCTVTFANVGLVELAITDIAINGPFASSGVVPVPLYVTPGTARRARRLRRPCGARRGDGRRGRRRRRQRGVRGRRFAQRQRRRAVIVRPGLAAGQRRRALRGRRRWRCARAMR